MDYGNGNFNPDVIYAHNPYDAEGGATIAYGQTATDGYCELSAPSLDNLQDYPYEVADRIPDYPDAAYGNGNFKVEDRYPDPSAFGVQYTQTDNDQHNAQPGYYNGNVDTGSFPVYASDPAPVDGYGPPDQQMNPQQTAEDDEGEDQPTGRSSKPKEREIRDSPVGDWLEYRANSSSLWCKFPCYTRFDSPMLRFCSCRSSPPRHSGSLTSRGGSNSCSIWGLRYVLPTCNF